MLVAEAQWLGRVIYGMPAVAVFPMLNVGSGTGDFRTRDQPWIDRYLFASARVAGQVVTHLDIKPDSGVDLVGDLADSAFMDRLAGMRFASVMCSNLLEHVTDRQAIGSTLARLIPPGGHLFVSCPYRFPYHPDPIDTRFRPTVEELAALFPDTEVVHGEIVDCGTWFPYLLREVARNPLMVVRAVDRRVAPRRQAPEAAASTTSEDRPESLAPWVFKKMKATCVVLRKRDRMPRPEDVGAARAAPGEGAVD